MHAAARLVFSAFLGMLSVSVGQAAPNLKMPYAQAGLTEQQAAAVLLDRFTFGAKPGEVDGVTRQGLNQWFETQLTASQQDAELGSRLAVYPAVGMTHRQLMSRFPSGSQSAAEARRAYDLIPPADVQVDFDWTSKKLAKFRQENGQLSQDNELYQQLTGQKIVRATYARNQLVEVLTNFWQNHFYITSSNFRSKPWVLAYESEAIRPNALGSFRELLVAAAKHPAKVQATFGDAQKSVLTESQTTMGLAFSALEKEGKGETVTAIQQQITRIDNEDDLLLQRRFWPATGPNLEYARLLLQQTLGKGGPYTQKDVEEAARIFTGWTTLPYGVNEQWFTGGFLIAAPAGFVQQGSFVFRADRHDAGPKQALGQRFAAGGGFNEGEQLLEVLAKNPATATNIARALAEQFVGPEPETKLVGALATSFRSSQGDIRTVMRTLVQSEAFWREAAERTKVKSPFEYAVSALRASNAEVTDTVSLNQWIGFMGEPLYAYADANGLPRNREWVSGGSLTTRVKFALALSGDDVSGVSLPAGANTERLALQIASPQFQVR